MAILNWYIDDKLADEGFVHRYMDGTEAPRRSAPRQNRSERDGMATVGLQFAIRPNVLGVAVEIRNVTCLAVVADIYKSATTAKLMIFDRSAAQRHRTTTIRPPSHLHASGRNCGASFGALRWIWLLAMTILHWIYVGG